MENKKSIIGRVVVVLVIVALVVIGGLIINRKEAQIKQLNTEAQNLGNVVANKDSVINDMFNSFDEIQSNLDMIKQKRNQIEIVQNEGKLSKKASIERDIHLLDSLLDQNDAKIKALQSKLKKSGIQLSSLNKKLAELAQNLKEQTAQVVQMKQQLQDRDLKIADLNTKVDDLSNEIDVKDQTLAVKSDSIKVQDTKLNQAYLAYGSYKELKDNGVIKKDGGFLGIGGKKMLSGDVNDSSFMKLDIRKTREIPLFAKKATIITEHPDSSYKFLVDGGQITYLEIENPQEFWKMSKYAVIETK